MNKLENINACDLVITLIVNTLLLTYIKAIVS